MKRMLHLFATCLLLMCAPLVLYACAAAQPTGADIGQNWYEDSIIKIVNEPLYVKGFDKPDGAIISVFIVMKIENISDVKVNDLNIDFDIYDKDNRKVALENLVSLPQFTIEKLEVGESMDILTLVRFNELDEQINPSHIVITSVLTA